MKYPLPMECHECSMKSTVWAELHETLLNEKCPGCGYEQTSLIITNITIGEKLLERSRFELSEKHDYTLSIVFSATAFECELSDCYYKWRLSKSIDRLEAPPSDEEIEEMLRRFYNIVAKIEGASKFACPDGFAGFVKSVNELKNTVNENFPSLNVDSLAKSFQEKLFWPRNRILHSGKTDQYQESDAIKCFNIARLGIEILKQMDKKKWDEWDKAERT